MGHFEELYSILTAKEVDLLESLLGGPFQCENTASFDKLIRNSLAKVDAAKRWFDGQTVILITPTGKDFLAYAHQRRAEEAQNEAKERRAEAKRLQERHDDYANEERRYRTQNKIQIIMPLVTFILGLLAEHFYGVLGFFFNLFQ